MRRALTLALLVGCLWPVPVRAQVIFQSDIRAATAPDYGFDSRVDDCGAGTNCTLTRLDAASPSGNDALRIVATATGDASQFDIFWFVDDDNLPAVTQGQTRYARWRFRINSPVYWPSNQGGPNNRSAGGKAFVINNACNEEEGRVIASLGSNAPDRDDPFFELDRNIDGLDIVAPDLSIGGWHAIQIAMVSSSTDVATDGALRLYIDNDTVGAPTDSASGFALPTANWGSGPEACTLVWGFTAFNALAVGGTFSVDIADFEYASSFDADWAAASGGGSAPEVVPAGLSPRVRIRAASGPAPHPGDPRGGQQQHIEHARAGREEDAQQSRGRFPVEIVVRRHAVPYAGSQVGGTRVTRPAVQSDRWGVER